MGTSGLQRSGQSGEIVPPCPQPNPERVQVPNALGFCFQKPPRAWALVPEASSIGRLEPLGEEDSAQSMRPLLQSDSFDTFKLSSMGPWFGVGSVGGVLGSSGGWPGDLWRHRRPSDERSGVMKRGRGIHIWKELRLGGVRLPHKAYQGPGLARNIDRSSHGGLKFNVSLGPAEPLW